MAVGGRELAKGGMINRSTVLCQGHDKVSPMAASIHYTSERGSISNTRMCDDSFAYLHNMQNRMKFKLIIIVCMFMCRAIENEASCFSIFKI